MIIDPFFYFCAVPAILIFGMAKGGFGGGIAVVSVPLMSLAISPIQAAAILLPILLVMDAVALWSFRGQWDRLNIKILLPGAVIGIVLGSIGFRYLSEDMIRILIGVIAVLFCLNYWFKPSSAKAQGPSIIRGGFWGAVAGFTSFGIHAGGPPVNMYLLPQRLEKSLLMGTMAIFFAVVNVIKLIPYSLQGSFDHTNLLTAAVLMPLAPVGVRLGFYLLHKVSEKTIYRICYFFLFIVGIKLLFDGGQGAWSTYF
ncbi:sulfite exporter TauE/SafE family protein [uncultured Zhongshania sp.]|uniref:sulfite exporter TauE/SafE family protein n=1 Tax=uncultured Zhongshania sp. TaxID=1642288 RepID=UPI0025F5DE38|nr:sulfite exporter TauE/SafE family protein [uncultured Zhongshania sp.]